jgi:hypothetical protein
VEADMNAHGQQTTEAARSISLELNKRGYDVYYDHGKKGDFVGKIAVSINKELGRIKEISQLDIAVIKKDTNKAIALVEIEETTDNPKKLIGDLFAVLMGSSIHPPRIEKVRVGKWTTLIIIGKGAGHDVRNGRILKLANKAKSALGTVNSGIGNIVIKSVSENDDLDKILMEEIDEAIQRNV